MYKGFIQFFTYQQTYPVIYNSILGDSTKNPASLFNETGFFIFSSGTLYTSTLLLPLSALHGSLLPSGLVSTIDFLSNKKVPINRDFSFIIYNLKFIIQLLAFQCKVCFKLSGNSSRWFYKIYRKPIIIRWQ